MQSQDATWIATAGQVALHHVALDVHIIHVRRVEKRQPMHQWVANPQVRADDNHNVCAVLLAIISVELPNASFRVIGYSSIAL